MEKRCPKREYRTLETLLFAAGEPVSVSNMSKVLGLTEGECRRLAENLARIYEEEERGMQIIRLEKAYQMTTRPMYYDDIKVLYQSSQKVRLTETQLETLAIVAYKQPVTKQEIDDIRGVKSDNVVNRLMEFGLVEEAGRLKAPGRPALFKTTDEFLRSFGLSSIKEMPGLPEQETVDFGQQLSLPEQDAETAMDEAEQAEEVSADQETEE